MEVFKNGIYISCMECFSKLKALLNYLGILLNKNFESVDLGQGLKFYMSNKHLGNTSAL